MWEEDPLIGQVLGDRYQIVEPLGQGGMGAVYLAERLPDELEVAVKIIRRVHLHNPTVHERFLREVKHTSSIHSKNVVRILDSGMTPNGRAFMVMELLKGESLTERLRRPPALGVYEALYIARYASRALSAAHGAGVIHRDLKPDNIFLCEDGTVKVVDFGIAKAFAGDDKKTVSEPSLTEAHRVVGTPVYMAPEVITKVGLYPASDLYALGVILYEMMAGEPPFYGKDAIGTMYRHLHETPRRLREVDPNLQIPGGLETLVRSLLEKKAADRPDEAAAVEQKLRALMHVVRDNERRPAPKEVGEVTRVWKPEDRESLPPSPAKRDKRSRRRRATRVGVGKLAFAAGLALLVGFAATAAVIYIIEHTGQDTVRLPGSEVRSGVGAPDAP